MKYVILFWLICYLITVIYVLLDWKEIKDQFFKAAPFPFLTLEINVLIVLLFGFFISPVITWWIIDFFIKKAARRFGRWLVWQRVKRKTRRRYEEKLRNDPEFMRKGGEIVREVIKQMEEEDRQS